MNPVSNYWFANKPGIFIGFGIGSMLVSTALAFKYAPLAKDALKEKHEELETDKLEPVEIIKTVGPYLLPSTLFAITGVACIIGGNQININRGAAAMAAYALSESTLRNYRDSAKEVVGEKKEKDIRENASKKMYYEDLKNDKITVISNGVGEFWMYDHLTKQKIKSTVQKIKEGINNLNYRLNHGERISVYDYCLELNEEPVELGNSYGWSIDRTGLIELFNPTAFVMENGEPVIDISHKVDPVPFY